METNIPPAEVNNPAPSAPGMEPTPNPAKPASALVISR